MKRLISLMLAAAFVLSLGAALSPASLADELPSVTDAAEVAVIELV